MGRGQVYYSPRCLWQAILDPHYRDQYDDITSVTKVIQRLNSQTFLQYTAHKPIESGMDLFPYTNKLL